MQFRGEYAFLSNFYPCPISININETLMHFKCVESAFQACKCPSRAAEFTSLNGREAKALGRKVKMREDWECIKVATMYKLLSIKFQRNSPLLDKLLEIDTEIVEENNWGDRFWGVCNGEGVNTLGRLLMTIRDTERKRRQNE